MKAFAKVCRWCGGSVVDSLCVSGWSACAGKIPYRLALEELRDLERVEAKAEREAEGSRP
jgi:hypothetical protein